jgi:hypothetical protein
MFVFVLLVFCACLVKYLQSTGELIPAVESDFLFMEIKETTLPVQSAGLGVFAKVTIPSGEILCEYRGAIISKESYDYISEYVFTTYAAGEALSIIPDFNKPICAYINDCVDIDRYHTAKRSSNSSFDVLSNSEQSLPLHAGYTINAAPQRTSLGKVFVVSIREISANEEIFFSYGREYWLPRIQKIWNGES